MKCALLKAKEYLSILPIYVGLEDTVETLVLKMYEFKLSKIIVCDKDFNVLGLISKDMVKSKIENEKSGEFLKIFFGQKISDVFFNIKNDVKITSAYLESDITKVIEAMNALGVKYMPVLKSPWNKTLKGFIELKKLEGIQGFCAALRHFP